MGADWGAGDRRAGGRRWGGGRELIWERCERQCASAPLTLKFGFLDPRPRAAGHCCALAILETTTNDGYQSHQYQPQHPRRLCKTLTASVSPAPRPPPLRCGTLAPSRRRCGGWSSSRHGSSRMCAGWRRWGNIIQQLVCKADNTYSKSCARAGADAGAGGVNARTPGKGSTQRLYSIPV